MMMMMMKFMNNEFVHRGKVRFLVAPELPNLQQRVACWMKGLNSLQTRLP